MPAKFKHLIEEAKAETFKAMDDGELRDFRFRFVQLFERFFHDPATDQIRGMAKVDFLSRYVELRIEMTRRGLGLPGEREIDRLVKDRVVRKGLWSLDVPGLGDVVLATDYVAITGDYIRDPREAGAVQVVIKAAAGARSVALEASLARILGQETGKEIRIAYERGGCAGAHMPVFDLILRPKATNRVSPAGPEGKTLYAGSEAIGKALTEAEKASVEAESAIIRESAKTARAKGIHKFEPAKWTHANGHPRCIICGAEESIGGICNKAPTKKDVMANAPSLERIGLDPEAIAAELTKGGAGSGNFGHAGGEGGEGSPGGSQGSGGGQARSVDPEWHNSISAGEKEAVSSWVGSEYADMRGRIVDRQSTGSPRVDRAADELEAMFDRYPNGGAQDKEITRGLHDVNPAAFEAVSWKQPGDKIEIDQCPQSWSLSREAAEGFASGGKSVIFVLPPGRQSTRELDVSKIGLPGEREVIMRTTNFRVVSVERTKYDITPRGDVKGDRLIVKLAESND